jgi:hypothetical protein
MLLTGSGPAFVSVIMRLHVTRIRPREAIPMAHVVSLDDPGLDQLAVSLAREGQSAF